MTCSMQGIPEILTETHLQRGMVHNSSSTQCKSHLQLNKMPLQQQGTTQIRGEEATSNHCWLWKEGNNKTCYIAGCISHNREVSGLQISYFPSQPEKCVNSVSHYGMQDNQIRSLSLLLMSKNLKRKKNLIET